MNVRASMVMLVIVAGALLASGCRSKTGATPIMQRQSFGRAPSGEEVSLFTLTNGHGMQARITTYGAALEALTVPDRNGKLGDVVLGYDDLGGYIKDKSFFGATIGRYANRITQGKFRLNGTVYKLPVNDGANHLHGGPEGFNKVVWSAKDASQTCAPALQLTYISKNGEEGYPGELTVQVTYTLTSQNELKIDYVATANNKDTVLNLTNHSYFNLAGAGDILHHRLVIYANRFTPVDATQIPTGELRSVKGTPFDFTVATAIGTRIQQNDQQLEFGRGYDHNWVLNGRTGVLHLAAQVYDPDSGRLLEISTTEPGVQFYSGNFLDGTVHGKGDNGYGYRSGFCLETQHFPDSPNKPEFPSTVLKAGEQYRSETIYKFGIG